MISILKARWFLLARILKAKDLVSPYRVNSERFGMVIYLFSEDDLIQLDIASALPNLFGDGLYV